MYTQRKQTIVDHYIGKKASIGEHDGERNPQISLSMSFSNCDISDFHAPQPLLRCPVPLVDVLVPLSLRMVAVVGSCIKLL